MNGQPETKTRRRAYILSEDMIRFLDAAAQKQGCTQSFLVRRAIADYFGIKDTVGLPGRKPKE